MHKNRIHLCRVVSPPKRLNKLLICVPSGWIQRRLQDNVIMVKYPTNELTTQAIKRALNYENYSRNWKTIKAEELSRINYNECKDILRKLQQDKIRRKRSYAHEQDSSETIFEDDGVIFESEMPAVQDTEASQEAVNKEQEHPAQPTEAIKTPRSRGVVCGPTRTIQLSSVRDKPKDQQTTEESQDQSNAQDIAYFQHYTHHTPAEKPNRNEPEDQPIRKKKIRLEAINNTCSKLVLTSRPANNIQLLSVYDDSIEQYKDQSNRLEVTVLPPINLQPEEATRDETEDQSSGNKTRSGPSKKKNVSDNDDTAGLANAMTDRELIQLARILQQRLSQNGLMSEFHKRNAFKDTLETENDVVDDEEDDEEQYTNEKEIEKKQIPLKPDISPKIKSPKGEKITIKKINPVSLPAEYDKNDTSWTLKYREPDKGLVEIPHDTGVYVEFKEMYDSLNEACKERDIKCLARLLLTHVFSDAALRICTLSGKRGASGPVRPGLNEHAIKVIVVFAINHGKEQKWPEVDYRTVLQSLRSKLKSLQRNLLYTIVPQKPQAM